MSTQPPIEDINAIVNRFQAWAGAQPSSRAKDGVRELTYDEAIRRTQRTGLPLPKAEDPVPVAVQSAKHRKATKSGKSKKKIAVKRRQPRGPRKPDDMTVPGPPAFHQVLAEKVSILPATTPQKLPVIEHKTTALSLRISLVEHTLLKRRASEANLSVSSYLRNCVLEVEELRTRVDHLLTVKEAPRLLSPRGGITDRITRLFSGMFGRKNALSLRA